jgi:hypothetical protein
MDSPQAPTAQDSAAAHETGVSNLTLHYERKLYLLADAPTNRHYAGKYLDLYQFPDGRIQIRAAGVSLPYSWPC